MLLFAAICIWFTGCDSNQTNANSDRKAGVYLETGSDSGYIPGAENTFTVVLPEQAKKNYSTLLLLVTRPSLLPDTSIAVQLEPQESVSRKVQVTLPGNAINVIAMVILNWEYSPDMGLYCKPSTKYKTASELYEILFSEQPDSLLDKITSNDDRSVTAALKLLDLMAKDESIRTPEHVEYVDSLIRQTLKGDEGLLLHLTLTLLTNQPQFDSLLATLTTMRAGGAALSNSAYSSLLIHSLKNEHLKSKRDKILSFVAGIMAKLPESSFSDDYIYLFRNRIVGKDYDSLVMNIAQLSKTIPVMNLLVRLTDAGKSSYSPASLLRAADFVEGVTDSVIALRKKKPGPSNHYEKNLWLSRQLTAFFETRLLFHTRPDNSYLHPSFVMMPTFGRSDNSAVGLAMLVGKQMDERGDTINSSPFYALNYRYLPSDSLGIEVLDRRFPPRPTPLQLDSLIGVLDARGLLGGESIHDIPTSILRQRTTTSKPSAIVFVSSTCSACGTELKYLVGLRQQEIIADILVIMVGKWSGNQKDVYLKNKNIICVQDPPFDFVDKLLIASVPTTLILRPNGTIFLRFDGMPPEERLKEALIAAAR